MNLSQTNNLLKRIVCVVLFSSVCFFRAGAVENYPAGARALALSNAFVSFSDTWSTFHNQAGLAGLRNISAGVFFESEFMVDELSLAAGSLVFPSGTGTFGVSFFQFGKGAFKENKAGLAFAKQLSGKFSAGIQLDYLSQTFPENKRSKGFATFEGGIIYSPVENFHLGAHIFNPLSEGIESPAGKKKMPAVFRVGGHYNFDKTVLVTFEILKDTGNPSLIKTGIEFMPLQNLALRFGVSGKPVKYTAGIGYKTGKITTDIGFSYHGNLGLTPSVSIQISL
ncbi:MAG: hypothetical protein J7L95_08595 [Prolixibacteraceae bacterium]|nr:hypothetical protein [Prolixibacteraceae bacterium]